MRACNYNPDATKDDGSCKAAKDGFDCNNNKLSAGADGATYFIRTQQPMLLMKSLSHAEVDLPENFEVGFEITPQKTPVKKWSNIIHFTATGKVVDRMLCVIISRVKCSCFVSSTRHPQPHGNGDAFFTSTFVVVC